MHALSTNVVLAVMTISKVLTLPMPCLGSAPSLFPHVLSWETSPPLKASFLWHLLWLRNLCSYTTFHFHYYNAIAQIAFCCERRKPYPNEFRRKALGFCWLQALLDQGLKWWQCTVPLSLSAPVTTLPCVYMLHCHTGCLSVEGKTTANSPQSPQLTILEESRQIQEKSNMHMQKPNVFWFLLFTCEPWEQGWSEPSRLHALMKVIGKMLSNTICPQHTIIPHLCCLFFFLNVYFPNIFYVSSMREKGLEVLLIPLLTNAEHTAQLTLETMNISKWINEINYDNVVSWFFFFFLFLMHFYWDDNC